MGRSITHLAIALATLTLVYASGRPATAGDIVIDTDTLDVTRNGSPYFFNGQLTDENTIGDVSHFLFQDDLDVDPNDTITVVGSKLASLVVGNNASLPAGSGLDCSAADTDPFPCGWDVSDGETCWAGYSAAASWPPPCRS